MAREATRARVAASRHSDEATHACPDRDVRQALRGPDYARSFVFVNRIAGFFSET